MTRSFYRRLLPIAFFIIASLLNVNTSAESTGSSPGGDFILTDHKGQLFDLKDVRGKLVLIFFGYTFCPDICPTELSSLALILNSLDHQADKVVALFITVDPERDTQAKLQQYVPFFSSRLVGLTGSVDEINKVADAYHVQRKIHEHEESDEYYLVDHSANLYVVNGEGKLVQIVPYGLPVEHILQIVQEELKHTYKLREKNQDEM